MCDGILTDLEAQGFGHDDIFGIHLAIEEALINAVKHGNNADERKEVKIDYSITPENFDISITDQGSGFDSDGVPDPCLEENLLKMTGRGVLLMKSYMDSVEYSRSANGNCVRMTKRKS